MEQQFKWESCEVDDAAKRDECYFSVGEQKMNILFCEKIKHENFRKECIAVIKQDSNLCKGITDASIKENCYLSNAIGEWLRCEVYDVYRDECYLSAGEQNKDVRFCGMIEYEEVKKRCIAIIEQNPSLCKDITDDSQKGLCYFIISFNTKNKELCEKIEDKETIDLCKNRLTQQMISAGNRI